MEKSSQGEQNKKNIILAVDDDTNLLEMYVVALKAKGLSVLQAKNGKEVMELLGNESDEISLVLLDIVMPEMDGYEVLRKMQNDEKYRKIPVIVATNLSTDLERRSVFALGAKDFLEKVKMNPSMVADKVKAMLDKNN